MFASHFRIATLICFLQTCVLVNHIACGGTILRNFCLSQPILSILQQRIHALLPTIQLVTQAEPDPNKTVYNETLAAALNALSGLCRNNKREYTSQPPPASEPDEAPLLLSLDQLLVCTAAVHPKIVCIALQALDRLTHYNKPAITVCFYHLSYFLVHL